MGKNVIQPVIFAVSGYKNTGKTTLITGIIPILAEKGYQVAVIKHDGHEFESDVPGTDSYQHQKAGAYGTAVFSKSQFLVTKRVPEITAEMLLPFFPEADRFLKSFQQNQFCRIIHQELHLYQSIFSYFSAILSARITFSL